MSNEGMMRRILWFLLAFNLVVLADASAQIIRGSGGGGGGVTGWPTVLSESASTSEAAGQFLTPVCGGVVNNCDRGFQLAAGKKLEFTNSSATPIYTLTNDTGALTNVTLDAEASGNAMTIKRYRWFAAAGCNNTTASTIWDLPASNPAVAACRTGTNTTKGVLDFADGATSLTAQLTEYLHEDWTGVIDATILWQSASTSTNPVVWQLAIACAGAGESDDPAFTDDVFSADANLATAHQYNLTASNTITTTGTCAANKLMHLRIKRDPAHASDTLAATARLVGVSLKLRESQ